MSTVDDQSRWSELPVTASTNRDDELSIHMMSIGWCWIPLNSLIAVGQGRPVPQLWTSPKWPNELLGCSFDDSLDGSVNIDPKPNDQNRLGLRWLTSGFEDGSVQDQYAFVQPLACGRERFRVPSHPWLVKTLAGASQQLNGTSSAVTDVFSHPKKERREHTSNRGISRGQKLSRTWRADVLPFLSKIHGFSKPQPGYWLIRILATTFSGEAIATINREATGKEQ